MPAPLTCNRFAHPKEGHSAEEYEDAARADPDRGRFAVADGASESSYAGLWAELLCEAFIDSPVVGSPADWLEGVRESWRERVPAGVLPWYAEMKRDEEGAHATFLGVELHRSESWQAVAVGDACLVQLREGGFVRSFPAESAAEFDNVPSLLGSRRKAEVPPFVIGEGDFRPGDRVLLMTDALAQWCLSRQETGTPPWAMFDPLTADPAIFPEWVADRRGEGMRNDDVTLILIDLTVPRNRS